LKFVKEKEKTSFMELARSLEEARSSLTMVKQWLGSHLGEAPSAMFLMR